MLIIDAISKVLKLPYNIFNTFKHGLNILILKDNIVICLP